jgi:hypothetical protein
MYLTHRESTSNCHVISILKSDNKLQWHNCRRITLLYHSSRLYKILIPAKISKNKEVYIQWDKQHGFSHDLLGCDAMWNMVTTTHHNPECHNRHIHHCENLKSQHGFRQRRSTINLTFTIWQHKTWKTCNGISWYEKTYNSLHIQNFWEHSQKRCIKVMYRKLQNTLQACKTE